MMKKIALLLALALALSCCLLMLASCGGDDGETTESSAAENSTGTSTPAGTSSDASTADGSSSAAEESSAPADETTEPEQSDETTEPEETTEPDETTEPEETEPETTEPEASEPETSEPSGGNSDGGNLALGKSYENSELHRQGGADVNWAWDPNAPITYPDSGGELTDGKFSADDATYSDEAFMGFAAGSPDYETNGGYAYATINLGDVYDLSKLVAYVGTSMLGGGISVPGSVEFLVSDDGSSFTSVGTVVPTDDPSVPYVAATLDCNASGQYVQIRMTSAGWMFICEVEVY